MKKNIFFVFLALILLDNVNLQAQRGNGNPNFKNFRDGRISGKIIDETNLKGLPKASATLLRLKDSINAGGGVTDSDGNLVIEKIQSGAYLLRINYVGYEQLFIENIMITPMKSEYNFGTIGLKQVGELTDEVLVTAERDVIQFKAGKRIINVDQDIASRGGNVLDLLKNAPSVNVDVDGNVSLRGSGNVNILINGKPSTFLGGGSAVLEQLPANLIDHIEIITNPSAKYEAEGATGILNIVLKEEKDPGFNGLLTLNAGSYDRYSGAINLNYKLNGFNLFGSYGYNSFRGGMDGTTSRITMAGDSTSNLSQAMERRRAFNMHNLKAGIEYTPDRAQSIVLTGSYRPRITDFGGNTLSQQTFGQMPLIDSTLRKSFENSDSPNYDLSLNYRNNFDKEHFLTFDAFYSYSNDDEFTDYEQFQFYQFKNDLFEKSISLEDDKSIIIQSDYTNKLSNNYKLESGIRFSSRIRDTKFNYERLTDNNWVSDTSKLNNFLYDENIFATYLIMSADFSPLFLQAGLRAENSNIFGNNTVLALANRQN